MSSEQYWRKREEEALNRYITDEVEYDKHIKQIYTDMLDGIESEINAFYGKYAAVEGISISEAKKRVSKADIAAYERKAKKYVEAAAQDRKLNGGKTNTSGYYFSEKANEEMRLYNATMKINRLEMLKANIGLELIKGHSELEKFMSGILRGRTEEELKRQAGILGKSVKNNAAKAHAIVNGSFHNATFSDRIWQQQDLMKADLAKLLQSGLIQGKNARALSKDLRKYLVGDKHGKGARYNAERLMRTELARVQTEAQKQSFIRNGFDHYEFIANSGCCDICQSKNGKHFKVDKMLAGENAPPLHPHCRCSTAAWEDDAEYEAWLDYLDKGGTTSDWNKFAKEKWMKTVEKSGKRGIIKSGEAQKKAYTKVKTADIPSMDEARFNKIRTGLTKKGVAVIQDEDGDAYLAAMGAEAMTLSDGSAVIFQSGRVPTASATFEEVIHVSQIKKHGVIPAFGETDSVIEYLNREISANEKVLRNKNAYKLTPQDIESIQENLDMYRKQLKEVSRNV